MGKVKTGETMALSFDMQNAKENLINTVENADSNVLNDMEKRAIKNMIARAYATANGSQDKINDMALNDVEVAHMLTPLYIEVKKLACITNDNKKLLEAISKRKEKKCEPDTSNMPWLAVVLERNKWHVFAVFVVAFVSPNLTKFILEWITKLLSGG